MSNAVIDALAAQLQPLPVDPAYAAQYGDDVVYGRQYGEPQPRYNAADIQRIAQAIVDSGEPLQQDGKFYATTIPELNEALYGPDISRNLAFDGSGYRTPRNLDNNPAFDAAKGLLDTVLTGALSAALGGTSVFGDSVLGSILGSGAEQGIDSAVDGLLYDSNRVNISGVVGAQGEMPDLAEGPIERPWLEGLLGSGGIPIPIPGLPVSLPGDLDWGALMDMARATGRSIWDILTSMGDENTEEDVPDEDDRTHAPGPGGPIWRGDDDDPSISPFPGAPPPQDVEEDEDDPGLEPFPGSPPPQTIPNDGEEEPPITTPPFVPGPGAPPATGGGDNSAYLALLLPGLLGMMDRPDPAPRPDYELWDYIGPDRSYGYERPDYGTVQQRQPYQFAQQPSQPIQVGYDVQPRRDFLTVADQERLRRQGLL